MGLNYIRMLAFFFFGKYKQKKKKKAIRVKVTSLKKQSSCPYVK